MTRYRKLYLGVYLHFLMDQTNILFGFILFVDLILNMLGASSNVEILENGLL